MTRRTQIQAFLNKAPETRRLFQKKGRGLRTDKVSPPLEGRWCPDN